MRLILFYAAINLLLSGFSDVQCLASRNLTRFKRQSQCSSLEFRCDNGQCISEDYYCDGAVHCRDKSDETTKCREIKCASYLFQCTYGACVNGDAECDGKQDCADNSDETSPKCKTPGKPTQQKCGPGKFECTSGNCIEEIDVCDGVRNCDDGSDETRETCAGIQCPGFTYRCLYGGCVEKEARCNGLVECVDGSDEAGCQPGKGTTKRPIKPKPVTPAPLPPAPDSSSCALPAQPSWGAYDIGGNMKLPANTYVQQSTVLNYRCKPGYKFKPNAFPMTYCIGGTWSPEIQPCEEVCEKWKDVQHMEMTCKFDGKEVSCDFIKHGTFAELKCEQGFEDFALDHNNVRRCTYGRWDLGAPNCQPVCGKKVVGATVLTIGGKDTEFGEYPWAVLIYQNRVPICGGTIITPKLVISAAHCFDAPANGDYEMAAGKYFSQYVHDNDTNSQYKEFDMYRPTDYKAITRHYANDIAVLVVKKSEFQMTHYVSPVCMDWTNKLESEQLYHENLGVVTGWGFTKEGAEPANVLQKLPLPFIAKEQCKLPDDFDVYLTYDKFCTGFKNGSSPCQGDSGSGLTFRQPGRGGRYYLRGVVSVSPRNAAGSCNSHEHTLFTLVSKHRDFIRLYLYL